MAEILYMTPEQVDELDIVFFSERFRYKRFDHIE